MTLSMFQEKTREEYFFTDTAYLLVRRTIDYVVTLPVSSRYQVANYFLRGVLSEDDIRQLSTEVESDVTS